ncbi:MAG: tetratricopeptide repeat protein, partial [Chloroflexota bacterium]|nr:tetratricopeptide repeat protein [Chloroflexota bacterium]
MPSSSAFAAWLKRRRKTLDLTQADLAQRVGCSLDTMYRIEAGTRRPSKQVALRLAAALEIPPERQAAFLRLARDQQSRDETDAAEFLVQPPTAPASGSFCDTVTCQVHLPKPPTLIVGREQEVTELRAQLRRADVCLVTVIGQAGVGKTCLSLETAAGLAPAFGDGVYFVPLASIADAELVGPAIAAVLGVKELPGATIQQTLIDFLRNRRLLLVLDNFEQVVLAAPLVAELLSASPELKILVTSREPLGLSAEWLFDVEGLRYPPDDDVMEFESYSAVRLFAQRTRQVQRRWVLAGSEAQAVARICRLVEGLPLAIELAAAWVRLLSCAEIAREIARSLTFLTTSRQDVPARHRSLLAAFDHSWKLLSGEEQRVLRQLSVFRGGIARGAAEEVAAASLPLLSALVDKSLLRTRGRQLQGMVQATPWYDLHEMIRQYAWERLVASGEAAATQARHAAVCLALAEAAAPGLEGSEQVRWLDRLEGEHDNLRAALEWARASGQTELGLRLAGAIWRFWYTHGHLSEGRQWLEHLLARAGGSVSAPVQAAARHGAAMLAHAQNDYARAVALAEENLRLFERLSDKRGMADSLHTLALVARDQGDYACATARYERSLALRRELGDIRAIAASLNSLGVVAHDQGDYGRALARYEESLALRRELGDIGGMAGTLTNLGCLAHYQGDLPIAAAWLAEALGLLRTLGDKRVMAIALDNLAEVAHDQGDNERATALYVEGLVLKRGLNARELVAYS